MKVIKKIFAILVVLVLTTSSLNIFAVHDDETLYDSSYENTDENYDDVNKPATDITDAALDMYDATYSDPIPLIINVWHMIDGNVGDETVYSSSIELDQYLLDLVQANYEAYGFGFISFGKGELSLAGHTVDLAGSFAERSDGLDFSYRLDVSIEDSMVLIDRDAFAVALSLMGINDVISYYNVTVDIYINFLPITDKPTDPPTDEPTDRPTAPSTPPQSRPQALPPGEPQPYPTAPDAPPQEETLSIIYETNPTTVPPTASHVSDTSAVLEPVDPMPNAPRVNPQTGDGSSNSRGFYALLIILGIASTGVVIVMSMKRIEAIK